MDTRKLFESPAPKGRPPLYPFANMAVGQVVEITESIEKLQSYVHSYGKNSSKKFATRKVNGVLYVKRLS